MNMSITSQKRLSAEQIEAFYHAEFVADQVRDFSTLTADVPRHGVVADIGGGCGHFARMLVDNLGQAARVIDTDPVSIEACRASGLDAEQGDALEPKIRGDESVISFNLILHHLVTNSSSGTRALQIGSLAAWRSAGVKLFVNEYIYESYVPRASGWLIYQITSSRLLSSFGAIAARIIPAFKANTFGVGVRFRSSREWVSLFEEAGFQVTDGCIGAPERISPPLRLLLIKEIRRDSFLLAPRIDHAGSP
jgi:hypothetical protein